MSRTPKITAADALKGLGDYVDFHGAVHDDGCPADDTCECTGKPLNDGVNKAYRYLATLAEQVRARELTPPDDIDVLIADNTALRQERRNSTEWMCGCGWVNGCSLAVCAGCGRSVKEGSGRTLAEQAREGQTCETLREALEDMVYQFSYDAVKNGQPAIGTGGLSALKGAFEALGWADPYVIPDPVWCDAPVEPRCPNRPSCGTPTPNGYKHFCHEHFEHWKNAALGQAKEK